MKDLHNLVSPEHAASWRNIGASLGLSCGLLNIIEYDYHHKAEDCCNAVWEQWLDMGGTATWHKVIQAIDSLPVASLVVANKTLPGACTDMDVVYHAHNHMQKFYIKERYKISEDDWPPYQPEHFTSVALIHHKEKHTTVREVIAVATKIHKGSVEVVGNDAYPAQNTEQSMDMVLSDEYFMGCQSTKDITEIFAPRQETDTHSVTPDFVLIEGAPGIGKTILSKEIAFQWANKNLLTEKLLLFLIFLRDPFIRKIESLQEFVAYAICSSLQNEDVCLIARYLENTSGKDVTIVLDGYDEISLEIRHNSFIAKLINRKILKLCGLVITSRPTASAVLHGNVDRRVEILGFTKEDRMKYISQSLKGNPIEITQLETYLENNPFINSLCYIPLNMTILMCIFKEVLRNGNYTLPKNQTEINDQFICITISRFLRKKGTPTVIKCLAELPVPYKQQFKHLSRLAFELLGKDEVVFNDNDMKEYSNWCDLGLLKVVKYCNYLKDTPIMSYNFLHFTLQEFLAAYYVTSLSTLKQISILKRHFWDSRYLNSWVMYVGLTSGDSFALKHFLTGHKFIVQSLLVKARGIAIGTVSDKVKCLYLFQCFLEARNNGKCQQVGNYLVDEKIDLSNTTLLPKDMHTLSFFLTRSTTKQWKLLDLSKCYIGDDGCDILANLLIGDDKTNMLIDKMNFSNNHLTSRSICTVIKIVQYFNVKELILTGNLLDSETFLEGFFTNFIIQQQLYHEMLLCIQTNKNKLLVCALNCKDIIASPAQNYLHSTSEIYSLCLWNTTFKADHLLMLLSNVSTNTSIELNIYRKDLDSQILYIQSEIHKGMMAGKDNVLDSFSWHLKVSYLLVSHRQVLAYNVNHNQIIQIMKHSSNFCILVLDLSNCALSDKSLCTLGNVLSVDFKNIQFINLSGCCMEDAQCEHFCKALFSHSSVVKYL